MILARNPDFKILTFIKLRKQILKIRISGQNQKRVMRFFQILEGFYAYFLGFWSKIGGKGGHMDFFASEVCPNFRHILANFGMKKISNPKILFLRNKYLPIHYWSMIERIFIPQTCGAREKFVWIANNPNFEAQNLNKLLSP